ncbi:magnesium/cobalt transporter CorA [Chloroflexus sp. MS-CIW-1]|jgi:magnesium transporter|uniref:magnesium/cobalt transporter CorA n=1 Tax=Chloroflexus sp. MS-CIW-1 TaxID=3055768 RepID=UPI00264857EE|nr:magnesium/cobalt transporter CorA [Chloroflexus sp. MS-CIW-1]MDN5272178.1 magnesium/cobalt transporter CorA [Chloroflexus sp. MS-CIW-1]
MVTLRVFQRQQVEALTDLDQISELLMQPRTLIWLDLEQPTATEVALLHNEFGFHPLAIEDAIQTHERPKIETYPGYYLIIFYSIEYDADKRALHFLPITLFVGANYLVSIRTGPVRHVQQTLARWQGNGYVPGYQISSILYALIDGIVDDYFVVLDMIGEQIDDVEDAIFQRGRQEIAGEIFTLKKDLLLLRRIVAPERDILNVLLRQEVRIFQPRELTYVRDVYDHLVRITESIDLYRDLLSSALDSYLSLQGNQLNQLVKVLTLWSIILMACSLVAGIYGMNFVLMPELEQPWGYPFALSLMVVIAVSLAIYFKRRRWW